MSETAKQTLYSLAGTTTAGFLSITVFLRHGIFEGDPNPLDMPALVALSLVALSLVALSLVAVPTGFALLGWAAGRWEKNIQKKNIQEKNIQEKNPWEERPPQPRKRPGDFPCPES